MAALQREERCKKLGLETVIYNFGFNLIKDIASPDFRWRDLWPIALVQAAKLNVGISSNSSYFTDVATTMLVVYEYDNWQKELKVDISFIGRR